MQSQTCTHKARESQDYLHVTFPLCVQLVTLVVMHAIKEAILECSGVKEGQRKLSDHVKEYLLYTFELRTFDTTCISGIKAKCNTVTSSGPKPSGPQLPWYPVLRSLGPSLQKILG